MLPQLGTVLTGKTNLFDAGVFTIRGADLFNRSALRSAAFEKNASECSGAVCESSAAAMTQSAIDRLEICLFLFKLFVCMFHISIAEKGV